MSKPLGQYLLEMQAVSEEQLQAALATQKQSGKLLGEILRQQGAVTESALDLAVAFQRHEQSNKLGIRAAFLQVKALWGHGRLGIELPFLCLGAGLLSGVISFPIIFYFYSNWAWDMLGMTANRLPLLILSGGTLLLILVAVSLEACASALSVRVSTRLLARIAIDLHHNLIQRHLQRGSISDEISGSLYSQNLEQFAMQMESFLQKTPKAFASLLVFIVILLLNNVGMALIILMLAPVTLILPPWVASKAQLFLRKEVGFLSEAMSHIEPFFRFFRTTGGVLMARSVERMVKTLAPHHLNQANKWFYWNSSFNVSSFLNLLTLSSILIYGGWKVLQGEMPLALLFSLYLAVSFMLPRFNDVYDAYFHLQTAGNHADIINEQLRVATTQAGGGLIQEPIRCLEVHVQQYKRDGRLILPELFFRFQPGALYVISGESGSGKSTLAQLLSGILQGDEVFIRLFYANGEMNAQPLGQVAYSGQEHFFLEDLSVVGNLLTETAPGIEELERVQNLAHELGLVLDQRMSQVVSINREFSGGEKQRLHVLQGLLAPHAIRVFDEPTASLDMENARRLKQCLLKVPPHEIRIVISHDLDWDVPSSNRITLFAQGACV